MTVRTILVCNVCNLEIIDKNYITFFRDEGCYMHGHTRCVDKQMSSSRMGTADNNFVNQVAEFIFGKGK